MAFEYSFDKKSYIQRIDDFIKEKGISRAVFCVACGLDRSYLSKLALGQVGEPSRRTDATLQAVLEGRLKLPEPILRQPREPKPVIKFCPEDYDVTPLIQKVASSGQKVTYGKLKRLAVADWTLHQNGIQSG